MVKRSRRRAGQVYDQNALLQKTKLRMDEAAALMAGHEDTVRRWIHEGKLAGVRTPGGHWRVLVESVKPYL